MCFLLLLLQIIGSNDIEKLEASWCSYIRKCSCFEEFFYINDCRYYCEIIALNYWASNRLHGWDWLKSPISILLFRSDFQLYFRHNINCGLVSSYQVVAHYARLKHINVSTSFMETSMLVVQADSSLISRRIVPA